MEKLNLIFLDEDSRFLQAIGNFIKNNYDESVNVISYSDEETLKRDFSTFSNKDILIVGNSFNNENIREIAPKAFGILTDDKEVADEISEMIFKYQPGKIIYESIMNIYEESNRVFQKEVVENEIIKYTDEVLEVNNSIDTDILKETVSTYIQEITKENNMSDDEKQEILEKTFDSMKKVDLYEDMLALLDDEEALELIIWMDNIYVKTINGLKAAQFKILNYKSIKALINKILICLEESWDNSENNREGKLNTGESVQIYSSTPVLDDPIIIIKKKGFNIEEYFNKEENKIILDEILDIIQSKENVLVTTNGNKNKEETLKEVLKKIEKPMRIVQLIDSEGEQKIINSKVKNYIIENQKSLKDILSLEVERTIIPNANSEDILAVYRNTDIEKAGIMFIREDVKPMEFLNLLELELSRNNYLNSNIINKIIGRSINIVINIDYHNETVSIMKISRSSDGEIILE